GDLGVAEEAADLAFGLVGDADDDEVVLELLLELVEFGDEGAAGAAPGGPEVDEDDLALAVGLVGEDFLDDELGGLFAAEVVGGVEVFLDDRGPLRRRGRGRFGLFVRGAALREGVAGGGDEERGGEGGGAKHVHLLWYRSVPEGVAWRKGDWLTGAGAVLCCARRRCPEGV